MTEHTPARQSGARIRVVYTTSDHWRSVRRFNTLEAARMFAHEWVGRHPDVGRYYAASHDGVSKIEVEGCSLKELFPEPVFAETSNRESEL
jgi:hypothetical protein